MWTKNLEADARTGSPVKTFVLFAAVTVWAFLTGYYRMFSIFGAWDDEGYLMMTVKQFLDGDVLYKDIWTLYGPAYYIYKWLIHGLLNLPNTHDIVKLTTLTMWVLIALIGGLFVYRLTRSAFGGAAAYALVFLTLFITAYVPAHPQELCGVLIVVILLLMPGDNQKRGFTIRLILIGALAAGVFLTKINIGVFVCLALALTFVAFTKASRLQRFALIGLTLAAAILPFALFRKHLWMHWFELAILIATALFGALLVGLMKNNRAVFDLKHYAIVSLSFIAACVLMFLFAMPVNTAPSALFDGLVLTPLKFTGFATPEGMFYRFIIGWAIVAVGAAAAIAFYGKRKPFETGIAVLFLQTSFGLAVVLALLIGYYDIAITVVERVLGVSSITRAVYNNESVGHFIILNFATPFLWLLIVGQVRRRDFSNDFAPRAALLFTAALLPLQIYPVMGGSHIAIATFPMVIAAVLCLCDGFKGFKTLFPKPFGAARIYTALTAAAALTLILFGVHRTYMTREFFNSRFPLDLAGARRMRLSEAEAADYNFVVQNLKLKCDSFVSMPGLISFNFWAGIEPPTNLNVTGWMILLDDEQQREIVEKLKTSQNGCAVYSPRWTGFWRQWVWRGQTLESLPLSAYILKDYAAVGTAGDFQFMRQNGVTEQLVYAARLLPGEQNQIEFVLPPAFDFDIYRVELFDIKAQRAVADSQTSPVILSDEQNATIDFPIARDDSPAARKYRLQWSNINPAELTDIKNLVLRLYDKDNRIIAHLPFPVN